MRKEGQDQSQEPRCTVEHRLRLHRIGKLQHHLHREPKEHRNGHGAGQDEGCTTQSVDGSAIGAVAKPDPREAHQLLRTNRQSRQGGGNLNVLDQKTIQQSQDQDREQAETELKQTQLQSEP